MRFVRLALALATLAAALATPKPAEANGGCKAIIYVGHPYYSCGYVGGYCPNCRYECSNGDYKTWNTCENEE